MHRLLAASCLASFLATAAPATTLSVGTTADLVAEAERVCCAVVDGIESRRDPRTGFVFTHVRLRLLEEMKGRGAGTAIELRLPGGRADGVRTVAVGLPRFDLGLEAVLLLGPPNRDGYPVLLKGDGGVLRLRADAEGRRCLSSRVSGFAELRDARTVTLDAFRGAVKRLLRERAPEGGR